MESLCPVVEARFQLEAKIENAYSLIYKTVNELVGSGLSVAREIPTPSGTSPRKPSYVILEYSSPRGLISSDRRQIELNFNDNGTRTIVSIKWSYPTYDYQLESLDRGMVRGIWARRAREVKEQTERLIGELKGRIGAREVAQDEEMVVKEIIKEKQVIVKVRCPYCKSLYDESLDKCPHCGGQV